MADFEITFENQDAEFDLTFSSDAEFGVEFGEVTRIAYEIYDGDVEFTPSEETQIVSTQGTALLSNITINPIPSNYGLITWNGTTLTVS